MSRAELELLLLVANMLGSVVQGENPRHWRPIYLALERLKKEYGLQYDHDADIEPAIYQKNNFGQLD